MMISMSEVMIMQASKQLLRYIATGKDIERKGLNFYKRSLSKIKDPNSRGLLKFLVKEEENHLKLFMDMEQKLLKGKKPKVPRKLKSPLFRKRDYKKMHSNRSETIGVFATALEMEERGIKFYADIARKIQDKELKRFLMSLSDWEKRHFKLIKEHQDAIYDAWYWEAMDMPALNM